MPQAHACRRAGQDQVAGLQCHELADVRQHRGYSKDEVARAAVLHALKALQDADALKQQLVAQIQRVDELNRQLSEMATTDALTGLNNRRMFDHSLQLELAIVERRETPLSLLVLDVDHFKRINDTHGHEVGDTVLVAIAQVLSGCARVIDIVARVGGEEFAVILPNTDTPGALEVAERMRTAVAQATWLAQPATISIGVATLQPAEDASSLYARADAALYAAKAAGRNRVELAPAERGA